MNKFIVIFVLLAASVWAQSSGGNRGSGSGTVNSCAAAGNAYYSASGTAVSCDTNVVDNGSGNIAFGAASPTITTTTTNAPLTISPNGTGPIILNVGAAASPTLQAMGAASNTGVVLTTTADCWVATGTIQGCFLAGGHEVGSAGSYLFSSTTAANGSAAMGISESVANGNTLSMDTTAARNESALLRNGNSCRVTTDITLTVNTATPVCSWSLPAVAKAWAWQCQIPWTISAGTGTNTLAIIANPSQTPTAATNGAAEIKTTNTNTATEAITAISASGGTTLLTSGTITPAATVFMSSTSGTLLASATAGTFAIQMTAAGTTATAAAKAGATCLLY